jgi:flavin reductase (DIM6/NTAB) family NADH-FMN oxidoreductase RutF
MFYEPDKNDHGLPYDPFKSITVPRPIGWVTTLDRNGVVNLAPYSQTQNLGYDPPYVMFAAAYGNDSPRNVADTGEFVLNMATFELRDAVNLTAQPVPPDVDESRLAGLEMIPSRIVKPPRVAASPAHLECRYTCSLMLPGRTPGGGIVVVVGRVVGVHIADDAIGPDGKVDVLKLRPLARMGYLDYTTVDSIFAMPPVGEAAAFLSRGLEGRGSVQGT